MSRAGAVIDSTGARTAPNFTRFGVSATGDNEIVGAQGAGKKIRVLAVLLNVTVALGIHFRSATNPITGTLILSVNSALILPYSDIGWFETAANEALNLNLTATVVAAGVVVWELA